MKLKSILFSVLIASVLVLSPLNSSAKNYLYSITADPIRFLGFDELVVTYEQQIARANSFTVLGSYHSIGGLTAFGLGGSYRFYLLEDNAQPIEGFSAGPVLQMQYWSHDQEAIDDSFVLAVGAEAAYKFVIQSFTIEPNIRAVYDVVTFDALTYEYFAFGLNLGYSW
ncbi:MAG: hypothetical protein ACLFR2_06455 [Candidatus Kapaibacterium sp.]